MQYRTRNLFNKLAFITYTYFGYHLLLKTISLFINNEVQKAKISPFVTFIITAYNEEDKIEAVCDRLLGCVFFTTTSLLDEGVTDIMDADVGAKVGLRWRKG